MLVLAIVVIGMVAAWVAHAVVYPSANLGWGSLLVVGLAGSFVGGALVSTLWGDGFSFRPSGIVGSIVGAMIIIGGMRIASSDRAHGVSK